MNLAPVLVTDNDTVREHAAQLIAKAGIRLVEDDDDDERLLVLLLGGAATERVEAIRQTLKRRPGLTIVAAMPTDTGSVQLQRAMRIGAHGIVLDGELARTLVPTLLAVMSGQLTAPRALRRQLAPRALSFRERQILGLVVAGNTNRQIADKLFVAESTVKTHLSSAFAKLDVRSRAEAAALILHPDEGHGLGVLTLPGEGDIAAA
jgi:DNA-binding NarL/FixJ family response regulator